MYALYFIAAIAALVAVISYAIGRINKQSYLHTPIRLPSFRKAAEEPVAEAEPEKHLTRTEQREQAYVEWYTQRNTAIHRSREQKTEPKVFVGVAIVHEEPVNETLEQARQPKSETNIDRWYRTAVGA